MENIKIGEMEEKIQKALNNLWNSLDDEFFNLTYSQEEMQEDIRLILNRYNYLDSKIENLINKNKELEELNNILSGVMRPLTELGEEHLKMINSMAQQLASKNFMKKVCKECIFEECIESKPKNCVIDYFKKKVRENNGP